MFQSQTRSQSPGDTSSVSRLICFSVLFQSQTRSQSPGDMACLIHQVAYVEVSIADAKPIPWRQYSICLAACLPPRFNRRREANPLACPSQHPQPHLQPPSGRDRRPDDRGPGAGRRRAARSPVVVAACFGLPGGLASSSSATSATVVRTAGFNRRREANPLATS